MSDALEREQFRRWRANKHAQQDRTLYITHLALHIGLWAGFLLPNTHLMTKWHLGYSLVLLLYGASLSLWSPATYRRRREAVVLAVRLLLMLMLRGGGNRRWTGAAMSPSGDEGSLATGVKLAVVGSGVAELMFHPLLLPSSSLAVHVALQALHLALVAAAHACDPWVCQALCSTATSAHLGRLRHLQWLSDCMDDISVVLLVHSPLPGSVRLYEPPNWDARAACWQLLGFLQFAVGFLLPCLVAATSWLHDRAAWLSPRLRRERRAAGQGAASPIANGSSAVASEAHGAWRSIRASDSAASLAAGAPNSTAVGAVDRELRRLQRQRERVDSCFPVLLPVAVTLCALAWWGLGMAVRHALLGAPLIGKPQLGCGLRAGSVIGASN